MRLAVIPARGGSKRIPRKNIKPFCGKPVIAWSIEAALQSHCFDRVIVSTDDNEIAAIARQLGAEVPFLRPASLSDDHTGTVPVIHHAIDTLDPTATLFTNVCCIYATAPFVTAEDIRNGFVALTNSACDYAFTVTSYASPIQRALRITNENRIEMLYPEYAGTRSQDLEEVWHDAGQHYWGRANAWREQRAIFGNSIPVPIPRHRVQDIDTSEDWQKAEWMFKAMNSQSTWPQV